MAMTKFKTTCETKLRSKPSIKSKAVKTIAKNKELNVVNGATKKITETNSKGKKVTYNWKEVKIGDKYYWTRATLKKVVSVVAKPVAHVNYRERAVESAKKIFPLSYQYECKHGDGGHSITTIKKNKKINCSGSCSAVLLDIGCLKSGRIYHRSKVGSDAVSKKNSFSKACGGDIDKLCNCKIIKVGKKWKNIPSAYKKAGCFYIQDSNFFMYMGLNKEGVPVFYNCNQSGKTYTSASMYIKHGNSYCTNEPVLYAIIPNE